MKNCDPLAYSLRAALGANDGAAGMNGAEITFRVHEIVDEELVRFKVAISPIIAYMLPFRVCRYGLRNSNEEAST